MKTKLFLLLSVLMASLTIIQAFDNHTLDAAIKAREVQRAALAASKKKVQDSRIAQKVAQVTHARMIKEREKIARLASQKAEKEKRVSQRLKHAKAETAVPVQKHPHAQTAVDLRLKNLRLQNRAQTLRKTQEDVTTLAKLVKNAELNITCNNLEKSLHEVTLVAEKARQIEALKSTTEATARLQRLVKDAKTKTILNEVARAL